MRLRKLVTITDNESVFQFHQIVEEVVRVIVVRRIERNQLCRSRARVALHSSCFQLTSMENRAPQTRHRRRGA